MKKDCFHCRHRWSSPTGWSLHWTSFLKAFLEIPSGVCKHFNNNACLLKICGPFYARKESPYFLVLEGCIPFCFRAKKRAFIANATRASPEMPAEGWFQWILLCGCYETPLGSVESKKNTSRLLSPVLTFFWCMLLLSCFRLNWRLLKGHDFGIPVI